MNRPALSAEIRDLAADLYGASPELDQIIDGYLAIYHTPYNNEESSVVASRLFGDRSVIRLQALIAEATAESKAVQDLDPTARHATKAALHNAATDLDHIANRAPGDEAAYNLDPA